MRCWFSGRIPAFQAGDKGSIPLRRTKIMRKIWKIFRIYFWQVRESNWAVCKAKFLKKIWDSEDGVEKQGAKRLCLVTDSSASAQNDEKLWKSLDVKIIVSLRGEMDITSVFGTAVLGSNPGEGTFTRQKLQDTRNKFKYRKKSEFFIRGFALFIF